MQNWQSQRKHTGETIIGDTVGYERNIEHRGITNYTVDRKKSTGENGNACERERKEGKSEKQRARE